MSDIYNFEREYTTRGNITFLSEKGTRNAGELEVFDFVPEEARQDNFRPWSLDDVEDSKVMDAIGRWGNDAMDGLSESYSADDRGRALAVSGGAAFIIAVGAVVLPELIK